MKRSRTLYWALWGTARMHPNTKGSKPLDQTLAVGIARRELGRCSTYDYGIEKGG